MKRCYRINGISICLLADEDFVQSECTAGFSVRDILKKAIFCIFFKGQIAVPKDAKCLYNKMPLSVYLSEGKLYRVYTPPTMAQPVAITVVERNTRYCTYSSQYPEYVLNSINMLNIAGFEELVYERNQYILHASFIEVGGQAILFSGPSGIGKSTRAELWCREKNAELINGDKALLCIKNGTLFASGLPVAGSSGIFLNRICPVKAIIFLEQETKNRTVRLSGTDAVRGLCRNMIINTWNEEFQSNAFLFACDIVGCTAVYFSGCNLEKESVEEQWQTVFPPDELIEKNEQL